jgi:1-acyl-sn-glycerol-3-phosphate acyltransferase
VTATARPTRPPSPVQAAPRRRFRVGRRFYVVSQWAVAGALHLLADIHVEGMERCPPHGSGGLILASNHLHVADIPLIGAWSPRQALFFAKSEVRRWPLVGPISAAYGSLYVRRGESDRQAIRDTLVELAAGEVVVFFPEGHRSHGEGLLRAQPGVALLAQRSGVQVWPVAVSGTERIGKQARPKVLLRAGEAFDPLAAARAEHGAAPTHQQVADTIMRRIAALLPQEYRGVYQ